MFRFIIPTLSALLFIASCTNPPASRAVVTGANPELLKLRGGPGLDYNVCAVPVPLIFSVWAD